MAQSQLITRRDLQNHGASTDFLAQFRVRVIEVQVAALGALGTMTVGWRFAGDTDFSAPDKSEAGSTWAWDVPDPAYASVTFPAATYAVGDTWTVSSSGSVTPVGGANAGVTATRQDIVDATITGVTSDVVTWTQPRIVPPILSLGEGQKGWAATVAVYRLKSRQGMTAGSAGVGDENLRMRALDAENDFKRIGASNNRPPDITDSSASNTGAGFAPPASRSLRGFGDFS